MKRYILLFVISIALIPNAFAKDEAIARESMAKAADIASSPKCNSKYTTTHNFNINTNSQEDSLKGSKDKYDEMMDTIENLAKTMGLKDFKLQSSSININPNYGYNGGKKYNMTAYYNYSSQDSQDLIFNFLEELEKKGIQGSYSSNTNAQYNASPCPVAAALQENVD